MEIRLRTSVPWSFVFALAACSGGSVATKTIQHVHVTASGAILAVTDELSLGRYFP